MPALVEDLLPREMRTRLGTVRRRLRTVDVALACERGVLAFIAAIVISFVLDTTLEPKLSIRWPFTFFLLGSALIAGLGFLALAMRRRLTDDSVAVLVEQVYPELEDGLVSSVQLARDLATGGHGHTSPALIRSVIQRTQNKARGLDFGRVVDSGPLLPATILTLAATAGLGVFSVQPTTRPLAEAWFKRCILGIKDARYPKAIELKVTVPGEREAEPPDPPTTAIARGDDVPVEIDVLKGRNKVDRIFVRTWPLQKDEATGKYRLKGRAEQTSLEQSGPNASSKYRKIYQNVTEPFEFEVVAGNVHEGPHRVVVVDRPRIEEARFWVTYPDYIGTKDNTPENKPETQPDLKVAVGSQIRYEVVSNKPLAQAKLAFETEDPNAPKPAPGQPAPEAPKTYGEAPKIGGAGKQDRRVLSGAFMVTKSVRFHFELVSLENYTDGPKPVVFSVSAVPDKPPEVRIIVPGRPKQVTPRAQVLFEIDLKDDYQLVKAELRYRIDVNGASPPAGQENKFDKADALPLAPNTTRAALCKFRFDLSELGLHPGDRVTYKVVAWDNNTLVDEDKRMGESAPNVLQVLAPEELARLLQDRLQRVKEDLIVTARAEKQAREDTDAFAGTLLGKTKLDDEDKKKLGLADYEQRKVTSRLVTAAQELERIVEERELNRLDDGHELDHEREIRDGVKTLAEKDSPVVSQNFDDARKAPALDERTKAVMGQIPGLQKKIEDALIEIINKIDERADFDEMIRAVRDLFGEHDRVLSRTKEELKKNEKDDRNR
jgi:hypothetical protein